MIRVYTISHFSLIRVYTICHSEQSDQGLYYLPFSAFWSGPTLFAILKSLISLYTIFCSQSDQHLHYLPSSTVWSESTILAILSKQYYQGATLFHILSSLIKIYIICDFQQSDQGLHYLLFSAFWSESLLFPFWAFWSGSTLFVILSCLIRVYTICHYQFYQGLHYFSFSAVWSRSTLSFSTVWWGSTLFAILSSLIMVKVHCHSQEQSEQCLHYLQFSAVWSGSPLFAILCSLIRVCTICHSQQSHEGQSPHCHSQEQSDQDLRYMQFSAVYHGLHYLPFSSVWSKSRCILSFWGKVWSWSTLFYILSSLIRIYTVCPSQQSDQGLHCFTFSAV